MEAQPISTQPGGSGERQKPPVANCPQGLEYLTTVDQLLIKQRVEFMDHKYTVKNILGQKVYFAVDDADDCCSRNCCGSDWPFQMTLFDNAQNRVMHLNRKTTVFLETMEVSAPPGNLIGIIDREFSFVTPSYNIKNHRGQTILRLEGPAITFSLSGNVTFKVIANGQVIGKIKKQWSGLGRELFTDADFFSISFPLDLDVRKKALILGAAFLIDAMFFDK